MTLDADSEGQLTRSKLEGERRQAKGAHICMAVVRRHGGPRCYFVDTEWERHFRRLLEGRTEAFAR
jgi:hypothetical protein